MSHSRRIATATAFILALAVGTLTATDGHTAVQFNKGEIKCQSGMVKGFAKHYASALKTHGKCLKDSTLAACTADAMDPGTKHGKAISKLAGKLGKATKKCAATCTSTDLSCNAVDQCPPNLAGATVCGSGDKRMELTAAGFPGLCSGTEDFSRQSHLNECAERIIGGSGDQMVDAVYGAVENIGALDKDAGKCLKTITKAVSKHTAAIAVAMGACRDTQNALNEATILLSECSTADPEAAAAIADANEDLDAAVRKKCTDGDIAQLDICANPLSGPSGAATDLDSAISCLQDIGREGAQSDEARDARSWISNSVIEFVYPRSLIPVCGDNVVNQGPNAFLLLGEECDGTDDDTCPGECFPPGDVWECTCPNVARARRFSSQALTKLDSGWTGRSHNSTVAEGAGYVTTRTGCDCTPAICQNTSTFATGSACSTNGDCGGGEQCVAFDLEFPANCIGDSTDSVCDDIGRVGPRCSYDLNGSDLCDDKNTVNPNGRHEQSDCAVCSQDSLNPGDFCASNVQCDAQCFDADDLPTGTPCTRQSDCDSSGGRCRGICDNSAECVTTTNGAPLPLVSSNNPVCVINVFQEDAIGTADIVTADHEQNYRQFSITSTGPQVLTPCPLCGGFCNGDTDLGRVCEGSCSITTSTRCRFDSDCPGGEFCDGTLTDECTDGDCELSNICYAGDNAGEACQVESSTVFGTVSGDCRPKGENNISGEGLNIAIKPLTSAPISFNDRDGYCDNATDPTETCTNNGDCGGGTCGKACTNPGFENYTCPCPGIGGIPTRPNQCDFACDAGANFGRGCATGGGSSGTATKCAGGANSGQNCDSDDDCPGSTCSTNPTQCTGMLYNTGLEGFPCTAGGAGDTFCQGLDDGAAMGGDPPSTATCEDSCPGGRCTPLCLQRSTCVGGSQPGAFCGSNADCTGGSCAAPTVVGFGVCASASLSHCDGVGKTGITCTLPGTTIECEDKSKGAGTCVTEPKACHFDGAFVDAAGTPTHFDSSGLYCIPATNSSTINNTAGLPGQGRLLSRGTIVPNYTVINP